MEAWLDSALARVLVTLVVPVLWGLGTAWFFDWLRARRSRRAAVELPHDSGAGRGAA